MKMLVWYFHLVHLKKCLENSIHLKILATFLCFFALVAYSFKEKEKKPRKFWLAWLLLLFSRIFLHFRYSVYSCVRVFIKSPRVVESIARKIYLIIRQSAVNASTHNQPTILQDFLPCVFFVLRNHIKHSIEDVLRPYSVNFLLHNLKIQPLIICSPLAFHWIICGV